MACVAVNWSDRKKPETSSSAKMRNTGIAGVKNAHMPMVAALMMPLTRMTLRNPKRLMIGLAVAFIDIEPTALANVMLPEANADRPNTIRFPSAVGIVRGFGAVDARDASLCRAEWAVVAKKA